MPLIQLVYASRPFGFDDLILTGILASARHTNARDSITGALLCREDLFMQMLEGAEDQVNAAYARIVKDDHHTDIHLLLKGRVIARLFPEWAMRHDSAQSWMWTREDVSAGAITAATAEDAGAVFTRLARQPPATPQTCPMKGAPA